jgi:hypothetical protein
MGNSGDDGGAADETDFEELLRGLPVDEVDGLAAAFEQLKAA